MAGEGSLLPTSGTVAKKRLGALAEAKCFAWAGSLFSRQLDNQQGPRFKTQKSPAESPPPGFGRANPAGVMAESHTSGGKSRSGAMCWGDL